MRAISRSRVTLATIDAAATDSSNASPATTASQSQPQSIFILPSTKTSLGRTGSDRTSIAFTLDRDRPGGLYEVMGEFASRGINLSKLESRPVKGALGLYYFFLDFEGHRLDAPCAGALEGVRRRAHKLHLLGSYPRVSLA